MNKTVITTALLLMLFSTMYARTEIFIMPPCDELDFAEPCEIDIWVVLQPISVRPISFMFNGVEQVDSIQRISIDTSGCRFFGVRVHRYTDSNQFLSKWFKVVSIKEVEGRIEGELLLNQRYSGIEARGSINVEDQIVTIKLTVPEGHYRLTPGTYKIVYRNLYSEVFLTVGQEWSVRLNDWESNWVRDMYPRRGLVDKVAERNAERDAQNRERARRGEPILLEEVPFINCCPFGFEPVPHATFEFRADRAGIYILIFDNRRTGVRRMFRVVVE